MGKQGKRILSAILLLAMMSALFALSVSAETKDVTDQVKMSYIVDTIYYGETVVREDAQFIAAVDYDESDLTCTVKSGVREIDTDIGAFIYEYPVIWITPLEDDTTGDNAYTAYHVNIPADGTYEFIFAMTGQLGDNNPLRGFGWTVDGGEKKQVKINDICFTGDYTYSYAYSETVDNPGSYYKMGYVSNIKETLTAGEHTIRVYLYEGCNIYCRPNFYGIYIQPEMTVDASGVEGSECDTNWYLIGDTLWINGCDNEIVKAEKYGWQKYADRVKNVVITDGVTGLCDRALSGMIAVQNVKLPAELEKVGIDVFTDCKDLKTLDFAGSSTAWKGVKGRDGISLPVVCAEDSVTVAPGTQTEPAAETPATEPTQSEPASAPADGTQTPTATPPATKPATAQTGGCGSLISGAGFLPLLAALFTCRKKRD